jgi:glucose/arabinose dehydrogenase
MKRNKLNRGVLAGVLLSITFLGACARTPVVYKPKDQITIDRKFVDYPAGFELKLVMANLDAPTAMTFDTDGTMLVAEGGIDGDEPHIYAVKPDNSLVTVYPSERRIPFSPVQPGFQIYGPVGGMAAEHHHIFVSHRDKDGRGVITQFGYDGSHKTIHADLAAEGDYGVTDVVIGPKDRLYFGVGAATNSAVVGLDNLLWMRKHPEFCDQSFVDLELLGLRFITKNPFAGLFGGSEIVNTGPFQPFGVSNRAHIPRAANGKPNSAVCSVALTGGDFVVEAFGIRYPRGLAFNEVNALYVTNDGMEMRGSRPVQDDPDVLLRVYYGYPPTWYGFPDYSSDMQPITEKRFQPPLSLLLPTGFPKLVWLIDHKASGLREIDENTQSLVKAKFQPLSGAAKLAFAPASGPFKRMHGDAFVALSGDRAPFATSGFELKAPVGYKVMRVNVDSGKVEDFIHNTEFLPGSKTGHEGKPLERPIDVKIGPDGAMYVLDFGEVEYKLSGRQKISSGTGRVFKLVATPQPSTQP